MGRGDCVEACSGSNRDGEELVGKDGGHVEPAGRQEDGPRSSPSTSVGSPAGSQTTWGTGREEGGQPWGALLLVPTPDSQVSQATPDLVSATPCDDPELWSRFPEDDVAMIPPLPGERGAAAGSLCKDPLPQGLIIDGHGERGIKYLGEEGTEDAAWG